MHPEHKNTAQQKINKKAKAQFGCLVRPLAWNRRRPYSTAPGPTWGRATINHHAKYQCQKTYRSQCYLPKTQSHTQLANCSTQPQDGQ